MNHDSHHFHLLRLAKARGLEAEPIRPGVYRVSSFSVPGRFYSVPVAGTCPCPSLNSCSHYALALDKWMWDEAPALERHEYEREKADDLLALRLRIYRGETTEADREYLKHCGVVYRAKHPSPAEASSSTVTTL